MDFTARLDAIRPSLKRYVLSLLPNSNDWEDVVQETFQMLWERRADYDPGGNFDAWARKIAWFKALSHRRDMQRKGLVTFSEEVLQRIAGPMEQGADQDDRRMEALRVCLSRLSSEELRLLRLKYVERVSLAAQARQCGWQPGRLQKALSRLRLSLRHCIESQLSKQP